MADPVSSISSTAATSPMTALVAVQSQVASETSRASVPVSTASPAAARSAPASPGAAPNTPAAAHSANAHAQGAKKPSADELKAAAKKLGEYFQPEQKVELQVDHDSGEGVVKVLDAQSKRMILQIPSKEVLAMARKLREAASPQTASGVLVDQEG